MNDKNLRVRRVGIVGHGNLGKAVLQTLKETPDMEAVAILTRRPNEVWGKVAPIPVCLPDPKLAKKIDIDVMILCGGSATDIPEQGPLFAEHFNTVDSYDDHPEIPHHKSIMNTIASRNGNVSIVSAGWDPGILSLIRKLFTAIFPNGNCNTFWGPGISQGHSNEARKIEGVLDARSYTMPKQEIIQRVKSGDGINYAAKESHKRVVYVVAEEGEIERIKIRKEISAIPHYFEGYETEVNFITQQEMDEKHSKLIHAGLVYSSEKTSDGNRLTQEYSCNLESNPLFTAKILVACARAACKIKNPGAYTLDDFPLKSLLLDIINLSW
ncbi:diaminopimelate dehydrogenase [Patescibacteria group bacterium]